jgi:hypothetical protein
VLLLCGVAAGQATIIGGFASNWGPAYGVYLAAPFVPLINTPSISLSSVAPSPVGASSSAFGLTAGATNSTLSISTQVPVSVYTQPVWYNSPAPQETMAEAAPQTSREQTVRAFDFGVSSDGGGIASRTPSASQVRKAARAYTNQDADRVNETNGTVRYGGKTEHI